MSSVIRYLSCFNIRTIFSYITARAGCCFAIYIVSFWRVSYVCGRAAIIRIHNFLVTRNSARLYRYPLIFFFFSIRLTSIACNFARAGGGIQPVSNFTGITTGAIPITAGFAARNGLLPFQSQYNHLVAAAAGAVFYRFARLPFQGAAGRRAAGTGQRNPVAR